jgi:hypothetical protein
VVLIVTKFVFTPDDDKTIIIIIIITITTTTIDVSRVLLLEG